MFLQARTGHRSVEMVRTPSRGLGLSSRRLLRDRSTTWYHLLSLLSLLLAFLLDRLIDLPVN